MIMTNCWESPRNKKFKEIPSQTLSNVYERAVIDGVDQATQTALGLWFGERELCVEDTNLWLKYYTRSLNMYMPRYRELLRLESVEWDPMVADYMERQIINNGYSQTTRDVADTSTTTGKSTDTNGSTTTNTGKNTVESNTDTQEAGTSRSETNGDSHSETSQKETTEFTHDGSSQTRNAGNTTTDNTNAVTSREQAISNNMGLTGTTPDSSTYNGTMVGEGASIDDVNYSVNFPRSLDWSYTSGQTQSKGATIGSKSSNSTDKTTQNTSATTDFEDKARDFTDHTNGVNVDEFHSDVTTGSTTGQSSTTATSTATDNGTTTVSGNGTSTSQSETKHGIIDDGTAKHEEDTRERYSGRHESPQDLMRRARDYIRLSNSIEWLVSKLDNCFISIYDW